MAPATGLTSSNQQLMQAYGNLPISFEANAGQTNAEVQYLTRGNGYALFLTSTSAVLDLEKVTPAMTSNSTPLTVTGSALTMNLIGADSGASAVGLDQLPGTSNYFIGNDSSKWRTDIANYGQVAYQDVYSGINVLYYGNQKQLEYDFLVVPGANPENIRLGFQGADNLSLDEQGNLVIGTATGNVLEHAPVAYQEVDGARQAVAGQFVLLGNNEVGFQLGAYDPALPLTIDPVLSYSTFIGGNNDDAAQGIQVDSAGNAYITGYTTSTNFPTTTGANQTSFGGTYDAFVTKLNATGTAAVYSTYLGGNDYDGGLRIAVDSNGNAYVSGATQSTDFPTTAGAFQTTANGGGDAFVTKLNATGTALVYSTYLGGSRGAEAYGIAVDSSGDAYVTGDTQSSDFPTTAGAFRTSYGGGGDAFVTKLNPAGTALIYSTYLGGSGQDGGIGLALDASGNAFVTGATSSANFPTTTGAYQTSAGGAATRSWPR